MARTVSDLITELDFNEYHKLFLDNNYYSILFPFLLVFAFIYTALSFVKIFQNKDGVPNKPVIFVISLVFSLMGIWFETKRGFVIGDLLMIMFPNISAITIGILTLYIVGALFGHNIFKGFYRKDFSAYLYFAVGAVGLGAVVFYLGIAMGIWDLDPLNATSYWNVVIGTGIFILGIVLLFTGEIPFGTLLLVVLGTYVANYGDESIIGYFVDPLVFIFVLVILLLSWMTGNRDRKIELNRRKEKRDKLIEEYKKDYGGELPKEYESRIYDIVDEAQKRAELEYKKLKDNK